MRSSSLVSLIHDLKKLFRIRGRLVNYALYLNVIAFVFHNVQHIFLIKQIQASSRVNLKEIYCNLTLSFRQSKKLFYQISLHLVHSIGLSRTCLSISKASYYSLVQ